jgi:Fanconi-associated nuclease 1
MALPQWASSSQLRGLGTLMRCVGPLATIRHVSRCLSRAAEEEAERNDLTVIRCPVCSKSFGEVVSESQMARHVDACLCQGEWREQNGSEGSKDRGPPEDPSGEPSSFLTVIVGRKYAGDSTETLTRGQRVFITLEGNNLHDENALLVSNSSGAAVGHLPAVVAEQLGPLLRDENVKAQGTVLRDALRTENVPVSVHVDFGDASRPAEHLETLRAIAEQHRTNLSETSQRFLHRLRHVFETVEVIERRALGDDERNLLAIFRELTDAGQLLFARLCQRNKTYFASNKIQASDVSDVQETVWELIERGVCAQVDLTDLKWSPVAEATAVVNDVFSNKAELIDMLDSIGRAPCKSTTKRDELVAQVVKGIQSQPKFTFGRPTVAPAKRMSGTCGTVFKISTSYLLAFHRIQRLFFLNEGHSLGRFHAVDAGLVRYPTFTITREREVFKNRDHYLEYEDALIDAHALIEAIEGKNDQAIAAALVPVWTFLDSQQNKIPPDETLPPFFVEYNGRWLNCLMATVGIGVLERQKAYGLAVERIQQLLGGMYCRERRGYWWIRLSVNLEHIGRPKDSLELAETALADPCIRPDERLTLRKRVLKLAKPPRRWLKPAWRNEMPQEPKSVTIEAVALQDSRQQSGAGQRCRYHGNDMAICSVEELALQYYASDRGGNYVGIHSESSVFTTIFSLLLWPALFDTEIPNVFRTTLQTAPLDLGYPGFYECRRDKIDEILGSVRSGEGPRLLAAAWMAHHGKAARGIGDWDRWDLAQLQTIVTCVGGKGIAAICWLLCQDYSNWTAGMPDLLLWHAGRGNAKLAEVKSQRDTLSDKQRAWIEYLEKAGVDVEVCLVREPKKRKNGMPSLQMAATGCPESPSHKTATNRSSE